MNDPVRILIVEDLPTDAELAQREIRPVLPAATFQRVETRPDFLAALESFQPDLVISDYRLPRFDGLTALKLALERIPLTPVIILTSAMNEDTAVECMKAGAVDYVIKEHIKRLGQAVVHALQQKQLRRERHQAELALRESEERFRTLYENVTIGLYRTTPDGRILMANPATLRLLGFDSFEELARRNLEPAGFPVNSPRGEFRRQLERDGVVTGFESSWLRQDGAPIFVRENARVIRDEAGQVLYYDGTFEDITEQKQAERALRESEARYRARTEELEALFTLSTHLRQAQTAEDILRVALREMRRVLAMDVGVISLLDAEGDFFYIAHADGPMAPSIGHTFGRDEGVGGHILRTRQPYVMDNYTADPNRLADAHRADYVGPAAFVPLQSENEVLGLLMMSRAPRAQPITPEEVRLLAAMGEMAGNALRRARLFDDVQRHLRRTQALHDIQLAVASSFDLQVTLSVVLEHALVQLEADAAAVLLFDPHALTLEYAAGRGFRARGLEHSRLRPSEGYAGRVVLEQQTVHIPNLAEATGRFERFPLIAREGFVAYYGVPLTAKGQLKGVLEIFHRSPHRADGDWLAFLETLASQAATAIDNLALFTDLQHSNLRLALAYDATIAGLSRALDLRDLETEGHTQRVTELAMRLAQAMGVNDAGLVHIRRGALLHDMGKIGIPDAILLKPDALTPDEWTIMRRHPEYAYDMFSTIEYLRPALDIPYCHHEKWDGSGYPRGLKGEEIPLAARLFAVVDVWDAVTSERPYRRAWPAARALAHIQEQAGKHFDPRVVEMFLNILAQQPGSALPLSEDEPET